MPELPTSDHEVSGSTPGLAGLHHVTLPVTDLDAACAWYERVLGARRNPRLGYHDDDGRRVAAVLEVPGLGTLLQLRSGIHPPTAVRGYQPITFQVEDLTHLQAWIEHLDAAGVDHSVVEQRKVGNSVTLASPDGTELRFQTRPPFMPESRTQRAVPGGRA